MNVLYHIIDSCEVKHLHIFTHAHAAPFSKNMFFVKLILFFDLKN